MVGEGGSLRDADARLLLPRPYAAATLLPSAAARWTPAFAAAGVSVRPGASLVVGDGAEVDSAVAAGAETLLLEGAVRRRSLRRAGFQVGRYLAVPAREQPRLMLPLELTALRELVRHHQAPTAGAQRIRDLVVTSPAGPALVGRVRSAAVITVASRVPLRPFILRAAESHGGPSAGAWLLLVGSGDALARATFVAAGRDFGRDAVAVKLSRVPGASGAGFDAEERALRLVAETGVGHAPQWRGGFTVSGLRCSVESAGAGESLGRRLRRSGLQGTRSLLEQMVRWTGELARATARPADRAPAPAEERRALAAATAATGLVAALPRVLAHRDLGSWNVVTDGSDFTVLDWESARTGALPLADLLYLATDALGLAAGADSQQDRFEHAVALHTGAAPESQLLFHWLSAHAALLELPRSAVGPLALLTWTSHEDSRRARLDRLPDGEQAAERPYAGRLAAVWRQHPLLGVDWPAFSAGAA